MNNLKRLKMLQKFIFKHAAQNSRVRQKNAVIGNDLRRPWQLCDPNMFTMYMWSTATETNKRQQPFWHCL